jgi:hypothetical protein
MFSKPLPRFVIPKTLASGSTAFYFNVPTLYRKLGCTISNEPLGQDYAVACGENGEGGRAAALNALFDEWNAKRKGGQSAAAVSPLTGRWIGFSENTNRARRISKRSHRGLGRTMSAPSC